MLKKILFLLLLLPLAQKNFACDCGAFPPLTNELFGKNPKQIVFKGKVMSIGECNEIAACIFEVQELFDGKAAKHLTAVYDCSSSCQMNFNPGEEWIIYGEYLQLEKINIEFCSRSRKIDPGNNAYAESEKIAYGVTVQEELSWLSENLGKKTIRPDDQNKEAAHKNEKPSPVSKIILLLISVSVLVLIILGSKKFLK